MCCKIIDERKSQLYFCTDFLLTVKFANSPRVVSKGEIELEMLLLDARFKY